jgi:hypothetical protein
MEDRLAGRLQLPLSLCNVVSVPIYLYRSYGECSSSGFLTEAFLLNDREEATISAEHVI